MDAAAVIDRMLERVTTTNTFCRAPWLARAGTRAAPLGDTWMKQAAGERATFAVQRGPLLAVIGHIDVNSGQSIAISNSRSGRGFGKVSSAVGVDMHRVYGKTRKRRARSFDSPLWRG